MLLHIIEYHLDVIYKPGTQMHLSNILSRLASHIDNSKANSIPGVAIMYMMLKSSQISYPYLWPKILK